MFYKTLASRLLDSICINFGFVLNVNRQQMRARYENYANESQEMGKGNNTIPVCKLADMGFVGVVGLLVD